MSRSLHRAPLALASDGSVLLNVGVFDIPKNVDRLIEFAMQERGAVFIAVAVSPAELDRLRAEIDDATLQSAFQLVGRRQARRRRKEHSIKRASSSASVRRSP